MAKKKASTSKKRFNEGQWKKIFKEFNDNGRSHGLPAARVDSFVIASWNLRQFGTIQGKKESERRRDIEAFRFIASVISHFDLVAIQEVKDDMASLRELTQLLPDYDVVVSDVTGNVERLAYLYRKGRVRRTELAAEIDIPMDEVQATLKENWEAFRDALEDYGKKKKSNPKFSGRVQLPDTIGFERAPHCISFEAGPDVTPIRFLAFNTHIVFGKKSDRTAEFQAFLDWLYQRWSRVDRIFAQNFVIFGDMNAEVAKGDLTTSRKELLEFIENADKESKAKARKRASNAAERKVIDQQVTLFPFTKDTKFLKVPPIGSNLSKTERFDQIILMVRTLEAQNPGPGLWEAGVLDLPTLASNALGGTQSAKFIEDRIKQQISDHLPIWLRMEIPNPLS
jgi:endonuclease/exonuclease/phosphatase family metal-dependent hydrolase